MGKKYIIELEEPEMFDERKYYQCSQMPWWAVSESIVENLTPYTAPDLEQVRKEAYDDGYNAGYGRKIDASYQEGISDAWEAARKIWEYDLTTLKEICGEGIMRMDWFMKFTASEAVEKIRQYEQRQGEQKEEKPIPVEDVMRQYLNMFCKGRSCTRCVLHDFTCGNGTHFLSEKHTVPDEEVRRAYAEVMQKMGKE